MSARLAIRIAGSGGQGVATAGALLAEAAAASGLHVTQFQAYGPASRGGASWTEVIVSPEPVGFPKAEELDVLVALTADACAASVAALRPGGLLVADRDAVRELPAGDFNVRLLPIQAVATASGSRQAANLAALGALVELTGAVAADALEAAVTRRFEGAAAQSGRRALAAGRHLVEGADG